MIHAWLTVQVRFLATWRCLQSAAIAEGSAPGERGATDLGLEDRAEMRTAAEPTGHGDAGDGQVRFTQKALGPGKANPDQVLMRTEAQMLMEQTFEWTPGDVGGA